MLLWSLLRGPGPLFSSRLISALTASTTTVVLLLPPFLTSPSICPRGVEPSPPKPRLLSERRYWDSNERAPGDRARVSGGHSGRPGLRGSGCVPEHRSGQALRACGHAMGGLFTYFWGSDTLDAIRRIQVRMWSASSSC